MVAAAGAKRRISLEAADVMALVEAMLGAISGGVGWAEVELVRQALSELAVDGGEWVGGRVLPHGGGRCPECGWSLMVACTEASTERWANGLIEVEPSHLVERVVDVTLGESYKTVEGEVWSLRCEQCGEEWVPAGVTIVRAANNEVSRGT